jgi:ribosomal protein S18 acetylase RimI-like enzyme
MTLKSATKKDKEQILDILYEIAEHLHSKKIIQWKEWLAPSKSDLKWIDDLIKNESFYLIEKEKTTIGIFSLSDTDDKYWGKSNDKAKYLHSLAILPKYKNQQIGKQIVDLIKTDLSKNKYTYLRLDCISSNQKLKNYYKNQGFNEVGVANVGVNSFTLFEYNV